MSVLLHQTLKGRMYKQVRQKSRYSMAVHDRCKGCVAENDTSLCWGIGPCEEDIIWVNAFPSVDKIRHPAAHMPRYQRGD